MGIIPRGHRVPVLASGLFASDGAFFCSFTLSGSGSVPWGQLLWLHGGRAIAFQRWRRSTVPSFTTRTEQSQFSSLRVLTLPPPALRSPPLPRMGLRLSSKVTSSCCRRADKYCSPCHRAPAPVWPSVCTSRDSPPASSEGTHIPRGATTPSVQTTLRPGTALGTQVIYLW